jgi:CDGSH-type Zn-finger protein
VLRAVIFESAGRLCNRQRKVEWFGDGERECRCMPEVHYCVVVAGKGNKGKGMASLQTRLSPSNLLYSLKVYGFCELTMKIKSIPNGPNVVETDEPLTCSVSGTEKDIRAPVYLCRCGLSKNKPFCDGSHLAAKFNAPAAEITAKQK